MLGAWVFCSPEGKYLHNFERYWRRAVQAAAIPDFRFHDLRHTFASHYMMRGGSIVKLQAILGHASVRTTQIYARLASRTT